MSDIDEYLIIKNNAVMKKLVSCEKRRKIIMDSIKSIEFKVDAGLNFKMVMNKIDGKDNADESKRWTKYLKDEDSGVRLGRGTRRASNILT